MMHVCANHPEVKTRKKCFECGKPICKTCEINFLNRSFCSFRCLRRSVWVSFKALFKAPNKASKSPISQHVHLTPTWLVSVLLFATVFGVLVLSVFSLRSEYKRQQWQQRVKDTVQSYMTDSLSLALEEVPDAMVLESSIDIHGEAADSVIVTLKVNGSVAAVTLPQENKFVFQDVGLRYGSNTLQVLGMDTQGNIKVLQTISTTYGAPRLSFLARDVRRGPIDRQWLALTFDGGSGDGAAEAILDILKRKQLKCTMFLTAAFINRYPDLVKRMLADGHEIGNHTRTHPHLTTYELDQTHQTRPEITKDVLQKELVDTAERFKQLTNQKMKPFWRAPFGEHNLEIRLWAAEVGYRQIGWTYTRNQTMDTMDWVADTSSSRYKSSEKVLQKLLAFGDSTETGANGSIILMHLDTQRQNDPVHNILPTFIDSMQTRGYTFVTISKLLGQ